MRFITEFIITDEDKKNDNWLEYVVAKQKHNGQTDMGTMIADLFGWQNPVYNEENRFRLCIEAFPMDKWIEFKQRLMTECTRPSTNAVLILEMIKELEFHGTKQQKEE